MIASAVAHTAVRAPAATAALVTAKQQADKTRNLRPLLLRLCGENVN